MTLSFHCTDATGHFRLGQFCFQWRNSFLLGTMYDEFGESCLTIGSRHFHFGQFRFV
jgi:hypothetical protein